MHLLDLLSPARVSAGVHATSKKRLLESLARLLTDNQDGALEAAVFDSLCARERLGSTALGHGVAIPHGRTAGLAAATGAFIRLAEPIDFGAPDGQPVDLVFALAVPEHFTHQHLLLLSQLAEMFGDAAFRERLRAAKDSTALYRLLSDWQSAHAA
ncbi:PTS sugar transporter subunit IIA [Rehaibacterium terrae]|jgi:PTS system nitrogen regulatory IIA component|uniref:PTS system nitrogen regulatory IIA component n=1 Tax=Rehaibacterium terrae TaxID=1341696 RepID=A0A7W7V7C9_9GAMM|nr:PTS sugar transporter subunit IIA [Rehaibacterium terrae]MBB5014590.1 PTS system nitrogen regulatory IIA component [Rehaibacterium terrae]